MSNHIVYEVVGSAITLGVSLWVAFGPLRHRLPKFLTRLAKYSVAFKLLMLSGLCWWGCYLNWPHRPPARVLGGLRPFGALVWILGSLGIGLIGGAIYVLQLKTSPAPAQAPKALPPAAPEAAKPTPGPAAAVKSS